MLLILQQIAAAASEKPDDSPGAALAWKAQQIIHTRYHLPVSASMLAKELHCNADYLGRVYRHVFRVTLTEAIHKTRIRHATALLSEGLLSVDAISAQCGFDDVGYFRRIFKRASGMTPSDYRRIYARVHINTA